MTTTVIDQTTENTEVFPCGAKTPRRPPDVEMTVKPSIESVQGFTGQMTFHAKGDVLEHTTWIRQSEHEAHQIKERFRLWIDGQHEVKA